MNQHLPGNIDQRVANRHDEFYVMPTDAYDRFCTCLKKPFAGASIASARSNARLHDMNLSKHLLSRVSVEVTGA